MKVIIIDDEEHARENLKRKLLSIDNDINIVDMASNINEAFVQIKNHAPDLIFLDIEMPEGDGFSLLEMFQTIHFDIVFVTAYTEFALRAFESMAIGYITKPIDNELLSKVYNRSKSNTSKVFDKDTLEALSNKLNGLNPTRRIALPTEKGLDLVDSDAIVMLQSSDGYTNIYLEAERTLLSSKRLKYFEEKLDSNFVRMHKSIIVNVDYIQKYHKAGIVILISGEELAVGRKYKGDIERIMNV